MCRLCPHKQTHTYTHKHIQHCLYSGTMIKLHTFYARVAPFKLLHFIWLSLFVLHTYVLYVHTHIHTQHIYPTHTALLKAINYSPFFSPFQDSSFRKRFTILYDVCVVDYIFKIYIYIYTW